MFHRYRQSVTLLVAFILGWSWDLLFYGQALGLSALLFVLLLLMALFGLGWMQSVRPTWRNLWLLVPLIFFAAMILARANAFVTFLNVVACLALLGLLAHFYAAGRVERLGLVGYPSVLLQVVGNAFVRQAPLVSASVDLQTVRQHSRRNLLPVLRGLLLATPVLAIFTCLLASADLVFASYVEDVLHLEFLADLMEWLWRGIIILAVAWFVAGGLVYALSRNPASDETSALEKALTPLAGFISIGFVETVIILTLVDLLFLVFVWIQFAYLFGGQVNISIEGYTYAEYARRGFFELLAVSLLTLGLILSLHRLVRCQTGWQRAIFKGLSSLMVALVVVILTSAFQRLLLYELAYGYTELRLYSHVFMIWLAATFVWFLVTLWLQPSRFAVGAFGLALGFLITLNIINPDAFIAEQNLARYADAFIADPNLDRSQASDKLDTYYLTTLSDDVVPVLVLALNQVSGQERQVLQDHLRARRERLAETIASQSWPSFHLAQWRAYAALSGMN
jgi:hypothetical protein